MKAKRDKPQDQTSKRGAAKAQSIDLLPDAWPRFERFIKEVVKAGPQHRKVKLAKKRKARND